MKDENIHYIVKYIIIGNMAVGKSNLLLKYSQNKFNPSHVSTIGAEFINKDAKLKNKHLYTIQIWDTAGQENFRSITRGYYKFSTCALIVYDLTNRNSFNYLKEWIDDCISLAPKTVLLVLIGNKKDLKDNRQVTFQEGKKLADENQMLFFETSAFTGENVKDAFENPLVVIDERIYRGYYKNPEQQGIKVKNVNQSSNPLGQQIISQKIITQKKKKECCK